MKRIEMDGVQETVWRCRVLVTLRTAGVFPFNGGDWSESLRREPAATGAVPRDHQLEIVRTDEVLLCALPEAVEADDVVAVNTRAGMVRLKAGGAVAARISRRALSAEEGRFVQSERLIAALSHAKDAKNAKVLKRSPKGPPACRLCGWRHDAGFSRIAIPGRRMIALHGVMAQIVALVHAAQAEGSGAVSTKDERLLKICGGYRHPCKVFDDLGRRKEYQVLFDTRRRGFVGLKMVGMKSE